MAIYMKVPFAQGSVTAAGYTNWIHIDSLQLDIEKNLSMETGSLKQRASGVPHFSVFTVTKYTEDASPGLLDEVVHGMSGHVIEIAVAEAGDKPKEFVRYKLTDAMPCAYCVSAAGESPHERLSFSYSKIEVAFTPHDTANRGSSPVRVAYDLSQGT
jgi:type VI secretion system secreted protein Hcp